ncbi:hypothetical protein V8C86DRAFT_1785081 [Haematococcus lacustris]
MVRLHELSLGCSFEDLLVEVFSLEGQDPESKPNDPAFTAIVRDQTAYCALVYRSSNKCQPSAVKKGRFFSVSGRVSSYKGRMQIQVGSSWGRMEKVNGAEVSGASPGLVMRGGHSSVLVLVGGGGKGAGGPALPL